MFLSGFLENEVMDENFGDVLNIGAHYQMRLSVILPFIQHVPRIFLISASTPPTFERGSLPMTCINFVIHLFIQIDSSATRSMPKPWTISRRYLIFVEEPG